MSDSEVDSEEDVIARVLVNSLWDSSDLSESEKSTEKSVDTAMRNILVGQVVSEAYDCRRVDNGNFYWTDRPECRKAHKRFLEPSNFFAHERDPQMRTQPISLALLRNINEFPQMRIISGKPPEEIDLSVSGDLNLKPGQVTDRNRIWNLKQPTQKKWEHNHLRDNGTLSASPGNPDDLKINDEIVPRVDRVESKQSLLEGSLSLPKLTSPTLKERISTSSLVSSSKEQKRTPTLDRYFNLENVLIKGNLFGDLEPEKTCTSESSLIKQNRGNAMLSTQSNSMKEGSSKISVSRKANKATKTKITRPPLGKFDMMQVTHIDVPPTNEFKRTPADENAQSIADISEKMEHYIPEKPRFTPSQHFRRKSRQGELSDTDSFSSVALSTNLSASDIFDSALVNEISTKHSYLKPRKNRRFSRKGKSYHSTPQYGSHSFYPSASQEARSRVMANSPLGGRRYQHPFEAKETKPFLEFEKPIEDKSWFSYVFGNISLSPFL